MSFVLLKILFMDDTLTLALTLKILSPLFQVDPPCTTTKLVSHIPPLVLFPFLER
jgi:hypothetical protein